VDAQLRNQQSAVFHVVDGEQGDLDGGENA
jgi:hypothetical protein